MKKTKNLYSFVCILFLFSNLFSQTKVIFDTDFGGDADDLGALVMLHNLIDTNECEVLAIMSWSTEKYAVSAIDAVNIYYNHAEIPIGTRKDSTFFMDWSYSKPITEQFPYTLNYSKAADATVLYRQILARNPDSSITIVTVGPLKNIENLLKSSSDSISELSGKELVEKKVKEFVIMGGQFPEGNYEWNFDGNMPNVTKYVVNNIHVPITFSGYEVGVKIKTGEVFNTTNPNSPLYVGFKYFSENAPWVKENFKGEILDNATYDQTAVLYAVKKGVGTYWDKVTGTCVPNEKGGNTWINSNNSQHSYLKLTIDNEELENLIEAITLNR
jgi:inosine-uridine nucleoside N-ribohydrolase